MSTYQIISEILTDINKDVSLYKKKYRDNMALKLVLEYAFDSRKKMILPEGTPPFKPDTLPAGMSPSNLYLYSKKLYIFCRSDLAKIRREQLFVQALESIHIDEAKLLVAIKDQNVDELYSNINEEFMLNEGLIHPEFIRTKSVSKETKARSNLRPKNEGRKLELKFTDDTKVKDKIGGKPKSDTKVDEPVKTETPKKKRGRPKKIKE